MIRKTSPYPFLIRLVLIIIIFGIAGYIELHL